MTIKIPYLNHQGMLRTSHYPLTISTSSEADFKPWTVRNDAFNWTKAQLYDSCNGVLQLFVLNNLQCGNATADIKIVVEISFEDMILMCPTVDGKVITGYNDLPGPLASISLSDWTDQGVDYPAAMTLMSEEPVIGLTVQGMEAPGTSEDMQMISGGAEVEEISKLYGGEYVPSLRSLLHRTYFYKCKSATMSALEVSVFTQQTVPRFPVPCNTRVNGFFDKLPANRTQAANTNFQATNPISLLSACFTGYRGSFVWKAYSLSHADSLALTKSQPEFSMTNISFSSFSAMDLFQFDGLTVAANYATNGLSWSSRELAGTVAAIFPQYNNMRMMPGDPITHYLSPKLHNADNFDNDGVKITVFRGQQYADKLGVKNSVATSVSAGTDFNVFNFVNIPDIYIRAAT